MTDRDFNRAILNEVGHRLWPMPDTPWVMTQTWHALLFATWRMDAGKLPDKVPPAFDLDLFDGTRWLPRRTIPSSVLCQGTPVPRNCCAWLSGDDRALVLKSFGSMVERYNGLSIS